MPNLPTCLVADDADSMLKLLMIFMDHLGFNSLTAHDGEEALAMIKQHQPQLVIADIHMPKRNGLQLLQDLRQLNPRLPVILITGYENYQPILETILPVTPDALLEKPFMLETLDGVVKSLRDKVNHAWPAPTPT